MEQKTKLCRIVRRSRHTSKQVFSLSGKFMFGLRKKNISGICCFHYYRFNFTNGSSKTIAH